MNCAFDISDTQPKRYLVITYLHRIISREAHHLDPSLPPLHDRFFPIMPAPDYKLVNAEAMLSVKNMKSAAAILIPTSAPLLIANTNTQPLLCLTATLLAFVLMRMTTNTSSQAAASCKISFGKNKEKKAIENVTITSMSNRVVRVSMGSCHLLGAVAYALRNFDGHSSLASWGLVGGQCLVSGIWLSSGKNGQ